MADWQSFAIQVPGKDLLEPVRNVLETLLVFLDVLKAILDTIKTFLVDFGNPIRALVEALIKLIEELFLSLKTSGVQGLFHVPNPIPDPNFDFNKGYDSFVEVFKSSLFDTKDFHRPQPRPGSTKGGFYLLMVQADSIFGLIARLQQLLRFFSKEFTTPRYEAPNNFKVSPVGEDGDDLLSVASVFANAPISAVSLSWTLPTSQETPDPGFSDLVNRVANEFVPAKYLIEKSVGVSPPSQLIDFADIKDEFAAGVVEIAREVPTATGAVINKREVLQDNYGDPVIKFTKYVVLDELTVSSLLGQLGKFRYIDTDVTPDTLYFYRVRAFSGDLKFTADDQIDWGEVETVKDNRSIPSVRWPSEFQDEAVVIPGKATGIVSVRIPAAVPDFDVLENLKRVYQAALTCDFHRDPPAETDPQSVSRDTGKGSLTKQAGVAALYVSSELESALLQQRTVPLSLTALTDPVTGEPPEMPWETFVVKRQASILADATASAMLEAGSDPLNSFRSLMRDINQDDPLGEETMELAVFKLTSTEDLVNVKATNFLQAYDSDVSEAFRTNLLGVINFIKSFTLGGLPPDWISINPLRDIIPWAGQILYDLLDKVQALLDAFNGVISEINAYIATLEQKIATLERTLEFLISILNLIESMQFSAYILAVPEIEGTVTDWVREVDTAGGTVPLRGPQGYSGGVALAYVAPDISAFKTAFSVIFGI